MAIALVTVGAFNSSASAATLTPALPGSRVNNNILIARCSVSATGKVITTATAGWTIGGSINTGNMSMAWAWRLVDGAEAAPVFTWTGAAATSAEVAQWSGNKTVSPIGNTASASANASTTLTAAGITTTANNSGVIQLLACSTSQTITSTTTTSYTNVTVNASANGSDRIYWGLVGTSGNASEAFSGTITSADWASLGLELVGPGGAVVSDAVRVTAVVQEVLESYSNPNNLRVTAVVQEVLESYSNPNNIRVTAVVQEVLEGYVNANARATQVVMQVLRSVAVSGTYVQHWKTGSGVGLTWSNAFSTATLNSIASGNAILSDLTIANGSPLDLYMDVSIALASAAFTGSTPGIHLFLYPLNQDNVTYGDGRFVASAVGPVSPTYWVATIELVALTQAQTGTAVGIVLPPGTFRLVLYNNGGVALASSGNTCQYRTYNRQIG